MIDKDSVPTNYLHISINLFTQNILESQMWGFFFVCSVISDLKDPMPYFIDNLCCGTVLIRKVNYTEMFQLTYVKKFFVHIALSCLLNYIFPVTYIQ